MEVEDPSARIISRREIQKAIDNIKSSYDEITPRVDLSRAEEAELHNWFKANPTRTLEAFMAKVNEVKQAKATKLVKKLQKKRAKKQRKR